MPGRTYTAASSYRYGFNGKENDNEVKGEGNQQDYGMRIYDPRLGKFLSVDPLSGQYPFYTPYQFAGNKPIWAVDIDGLEPKETSTPDAPIELEEVKVSSSSKRQAAINYISDNTPIFDFKWGGNISTAAFTNQLKDRILNPYSLDQGAGSNGGTGSNFCWIAAVASYQYQRDPVGMAAKMLELYSKGKTKIGSIELQISDAIRKAIGSNTFDNNGGLAGQFPDQLLFMTIAANYKGYVNLFNSSYDPEDEDKTWASGNFNKFDGLMRAFGSNVITSKGTDLGTKEIIGENGDLLMNAQKAGQNIFLFIYSAHFKHPPPDKAIAPSPSGTHFVQVRNVNKIGNQFSLEYWDYGEWKPHTISLKGLQRSVFGILTTKD